MHEFAIASELVAAVVREAERHGARRIERLECHVGIMRQVVPEMLAEAFAVAATGTLAERAVLHVETIPPVVTCRACGATEKPREWSFECSRCRSVDIRIEGGDELLLASVTLEVENGR